MGGFLVQVASLKVDCVSIHGHDMPVFCAKTKNICIFATLLATLAFLLDTFWLCIFVGDNPFFSALVPLAENSLSAPPNLGWPRGKVDRQNQNPTKKRSTIVFGLFWVTIHQILYKGHGFCRMFEVRAVVSALRRSGQKWEGFLQPKCGHSYTDRVETCWNQSKWGVFGSFLDNCGVFFFSSFFLNVVKPTP